MRKIGAPETTLRPESFDHAADVPVKLVVLYSSGVGYFEHHGNVDGSATADLSFKANQINDLLKSLTVVDRESGKAVSVSMPLDPQTFWSLAQPLDDFPIDPRLNALRNVAPRPRDMLPDPAAGRPR